MFDLKNKVALARLHVGTTFGIIRDVGLEHDSALEVKKMR